MTPGPQKVAQRGLWRVARQILKWTCLVVGGFLLCVLTFEIYLRLTMPYQPNLNIHEVDFEIGKRLKPGFKGTHYGADVDINSHGMRDREFQLRKPAGTDRILVLGDSWTYGAGVALEECWPKRLEALLASGPVPIEVMNTGVCGYDTYQEAVYYERDLKVFEHDLVLVGMYPVNDINDKARKYDRRKSLHNDYPLLYDIYMFPRRHLYVVHWFNQVRDQRKLRQRLEAHVKTQARSDADKGHFAAGETDWTNMYDESFSGWRLMKDSLQSIGRTAKACDARGAVILFPDLRDLTRYESYCRPKVQSVIEKAVRDAGLVFIDSWPHFRPYKGRETEIVLGGIRGATHLSPKGYEILARAISVELVRAKLLDEHTGHILRPLSPVHSRRTR